MAQTALISTPTRIRKKTYRRGRKFLKAASCLDESEAVELAERLAEHSPFRRLVQTNNARINNRSQRSL